MDETAKPKAHIKKPQVEITAGDAAWGFSKGLNVAANQKQDDVGFKKANAGVQM